MSKIYSVPGIFGGEDFYDESGRKVGYSVPGLFGGRDFYDADGRPAGYSVDSVISGENFYDHSGALRGYSTDGILGGKDYFEPPAAVPAGPRTAFSAVKISAWMIRSSRIRRIPILLINDTFSPVHPSVSKYRKRISFS